MDAIKNRRAEYQVREKTALGKGAREPDTRRLRSTEDIEACLLNGNANGYINWNWPRGANKD